MVFFSFSPEVFINIPQEFRMHTLPYFTGDIQIPIFFFSEALQRRLLERFVKILLHAQELHLGHLETLKSRVSNIEVKLNKTDVVRDQDLFIDYNHRTFVAPEDWKFEPCLIHYDTASFTIFICLNPAETSV